MNKFLRFYRQNQFMVLLAIIIIVFVLVMIQILNQAVKEQNEKNIQNMQTQEEISENKKDYKEESKSLVSQGSVLAEKQEELGKIVDDFLQYCVSGQTQRAYWLLSKDCKEVLYPSVEIFKEQYCSEKEGEDNTYSFRSWASSSSVSIYLAKIYSNNMLATGLVNNKNYIQDYISVIEEDGEYKLNVSSFVKNISRNEETRKNGIIITATNSKTFMDYEICEIKVQNTTSKVILLDTRQDTSTTYLIDENNVEFEALLYENQDDDFIIKSGETKEIQIKFSNSYTYTVSSRKIVFSNIIKDYNKYLEQNISEEDIVEIEVDL